MAYDWIKIRNSFTAEAEPLGHIPRLNFTYLKFDIMFICDPSRTREESAPVLLKAALTRLKDLFCF